MYKRTFFINFVREMNIAVIGQGRVASHLIEAVKNAGHAVICCGGRKRLCPVPEDSDIVIVSINDSAIAQVAEELKNCNSLVLHTAGSVDMNVLSCHRRGVLYPMQTFTIGRKLNYREIPLFIEANSKEDLQILRDFALSISDNVSEIDSAKRKTLHLAAVLCCNFVNHMYDLTSRILEKDNIPFSVMLPLIDETAAKVHCIAPHQAQTGPAVRWDKNVIDTHISMLDDKTTKEIYRLLSLSIHKK